MKKTVFKFFTVSLALLLAVSMMLPAVSALQFANGQEIGSGKATSVENKTLDTGYTYSKATYTDGDGDTQAVYALEFNPTSGNYMPIMYSKYTGTYGAGCRVQVRRKCRRRRECEFLFDSYRKHLCRILGS